MKDKLVAVNASGAMTNLISLPWGFELLAYAAKRDWIACATGDGTYIIELKTGRMGRVNDGSRVSRLMPAWNSTVTELATSGDHSPSDSPRLRRLGFTDIGDHDIWVNIIKPELGISASNDFRCLARFPGPDILPVWSKDDRCIYFAHHDSPDKGEGGFPRYYDHTATNWSIYRVRSDKNWDDKDAVKPEKIVGGLPTPQRLSLFPGGKRLLVSYAATDYHMLTTQELETPVPV
jgi:hypothetical protein